MKLHELANRVQSKTDFVEFVRALKEDLKSNRDKWENPTLETYLDSLASWVEDSDGYYRNQGLPIPTQPTWRNLADMFIAAKMYE